ncbi:MAG: formylglycine-generating enzyme family protein [Fuerstiella sp.]|nr:formylglycine-generating enzyme family protein [Fuerstiella sp.]
MKNFIPALIVLAVAVAGFVGAVLNSGSSSDRPAPPVAVAEAVDTTSNEVTAEPETPETAAEPTIACNVFGQPLPVTSEKSDLHNPDVIEAIKTKVPAGVLTKLQADAPAESDRNAGSREGMVWIPGGVAVMGNDAGPPDEMPPHPIAIDGFWMDTTEVTNRQFKAFVDATGYVTLPERKPELRSIQKGSGLDDIAILEEFNQPGSICSLQLNSLDDIDPGKGAYSWWQYTLGASWKHPEGPDSSIDDRMDHPVVHVSWMDAKAYCDWAGKTLPTEAQWEYAIRGGRDGEFYPWGNNRNPDGKWLHNIWQGTFPIEDKAEDGFTRTSPVRSFPPNDYGLFDMSGNVWEWCADYYQPEYYAVSPVHNPAGPDSSFDPQEPGIIKRVQRGGSFMCSDQYCIGYRISARMKGEEDTGAFHTGFRCVVNPETAASP